VAPIRVGSSYFWSNIWADLNANGDFVALNNANDVYTIGEFVTFANKIPLVSADYLTDGFVGAQSNGNISYFGGNVNSQGYMEYSWGWREGILPPMSGSPNWPQSEIQRSGFSSITPAAFGGKKVKQIQVAGWRVGVVALTDFVPEIDADTSTLLDISGNSFSLTLQGRYFHPVANDASRVSFKVNSTLFDCSVSSYTATQLDVACNRLSAGSISSTFLMGSVTRDNLTSSWSPVGVLNPVPVAPPAAPPVAVPVATPFAVPVAAPTSAPTFSATPDVSGTPVTFGFTSAANLDSTDLTSLASTLCNIAKQVTNKTSINCTIVAAARRAAGLHTAVLVPGDAATSIALTLNLALIQSTFIAAFAPAQSPTLSVPAVALVPADGAGNNNAGASNLGLSVGLGVGISLLVVIIAVIVLIVVLRNRKNGNSPTTKPAANTAPSPQPTSNYENAVVMESVSSSDASSAKVVKKTKKPKSKKKESSESDSSSSEEESVSNSSEKPIFKDDGVYGALPAEQPRQHRAYSHWAIPFSELDLGKSIGRGSFGVVYKGKWRGVTVAIKECAITDPGTLKEFLAEAELMLQMRPNPNVVQVLGVCVEGKKSYIIMEYLPRSLDKLVFDPKTRAEMSDQQIIRYAADIARGMLHISAEKIVHRDLACRNILLSKDKRAKISDFGMSRQLLDDVEGQTRTSFGVRFAKREVFFLKSLYLTRHFLFSH
jgi:hypothetical protein